MFVILFIQSKQIFWIILTLVEPVTVIMTLLINAIAFMPEPYYATGAAGGRSGVTKIGKFTKGVYTCFYFFDWVLA